MNTNIETKTIMVREMILQNSRKYWRLRRLQDIVLSLLAIALLWPFMLIVVLIIVIDSSGASSIFKQKRVGRDGKEFTFYKFRSMIPGVEGKIEYNKKRINDLISVT